MGKNTESEAAGDDSTALHNVHDRYERAHKRRQQAHADRAARYDAARLRRAAEMAKASGELHFTPITRAQEGALRAIVDDDRFLFNVRKAVMFFTIHTKRTRLPLAERRARLEHFGSCLRRSLASMRQLDDEDGSELSISFGPELDAVVEDRFGKADWLLHALLDEVQRAVSDIAPARGNPTRGDARVLRSWLTAALEQHQLDASPEAGGPLARAAAVAIEMIGDGAPDLRTVLAATNSRK